MKFSKKIFCILILVLSSTLVFGQIPIRQKVKSEPPISNYIPKTKEKRDSLQSEIYYIVMGSHSVDRDSIEMPELDYIGELRENITKSKGLKKSILQFYLAKIYVSYINKFSSSAKAANITSLQNLPEDYRTWAVNDFYREADRLFQQSLSLEKELQNQKTERWDDIIEDTDYAKYKPTLYDMIATSYLSFLDRLPFDYDNTKNSKIEDINNRLYKFHRNDKDKTAFIYIKSTQATGDAKSQILQLQNLVKEYPKEDFSSYILYQIAQLQEDEESSDNLKNAYQTCRQAITNIPNSEWTNSCKSLINDLENKSLDIEIFEQNLPNEYIPLKITHQNVDNFNIIYKKLSSTLDFTKEIKWRPYNTEDQQITNKNSELSDKEFKTDNIKLSKFDDFKKHQTYVAIPPLEQGVYQVEINSDFGESKKSIVVTDLLYIKRFENNVKVNFQVLNTKTGQSIANTAYIVYQNINDYEKKHNEEREDKLIKIGSGTTDTSGVFSLAKSEDREYKNAIIYFPISKKYLALNDNYNRMEDERENKNDESEDTEESFTIFTDRAIYRPGQKVFYKAILAQQYFEKTKVLPKQKVVVKLLDSNGKEVASADKITNEFGSVFGEFTLPSDGLMGDFHISLKTKLPNVDAKKKDDYFTVSDQTSFRVEEYKRPKFQVKINPVKETYKLGDKVKISGKGEAFSGTNIANANVKYEVKRQEIRIWRSYYYDYYPSYSSALTEIKHGETTTDENGNFSFDFEALADDKSVTKPRSYQYTISAYVTDINGESQSKNAYVTVGDLKAKISLDIPGKMMQSEWKNLNVSVSNLNNEKIESEGNIKIYKLKTEDKILLPKYATNRRYYSPNSEKILPYSLYSKEMFDAYFPYISYYALETNKPLQKGENVFSKKFKTSEGEQIPLNNNIKAGKYLIEAESIVDNDSIKTYKIVEVLDNETLKNGIPTYFAIKQDKKTYQVGQKMTISALSDFKEGFVNYRFWKNNAPTEFQQIAIKNGKTDINYEITDSDLKKGIGFEYDFIHDSDYESGQFKIDVKEKINRELEISTQVFRDKIQPGVPEKWILTIKGKDKDKINAEVLAAMYDASLDEFVKNDFKFTPYVPEVYDRYYYSNFNNSDNYYNRTYDFLSKLVRKNNLQKLEYGTKYKIKEGYAFEVPTFPQFDYTDISEYQASGSYYSRDSTRSAMIEEVVVTGFVGKKTQSTAAVTIIDGKMLDKVIPADEIAEIKKLNPDEAQAIYGEEAAGGATVITTKKALQQELLKNVKARTNLSETAFFMPNLYTDSGGNVKLEFNSPEALTQWKLLLFAHTKDLKTGSATYYTQTQKELMLTPNPPRFLRQGDKIQLSTKLDNLTDKELSPDVMLQLFDPITNKVLDSEFVNTDNLRKVKIAAKASSEVNWTIKVPRAMDNVGYKVLAKSNNFSDGEENTIPILADRILLSETLPIFIKEGQNKTFTMNSLLNDTSTSAANFNLTVEMTTNPLWFAVMSIPYLRTYPHECSEQLFSRLYGNMLSTYIMNSSPKIKKIFDEFNAKETPTNPLEENQELKMILLEETPWLSSIKDEKEQMKQLALFFNLNKMQRDLKKAQRDLVDRQNPDGSFSWFPGGNKDKTVSGHILAGFGKLEKMLKGQSDEFFTNQINKVISNSIDYLDKEYYDRLIEDRKVSSKLELNDYAPYFYYRSYWTNKKEIPSELKKVLTTVAKSYVENFDDYSLYHQAMITTFLQRFGYKDLAKQCVATLKKSATTTEENGMYWENNPSGWYWYQAPIETQAMLIEAFAEATPEDTKSVEEMKIWLLRNKQTESWGTTKSTTEAVYALLNYGKSWVDSEKGITMKLGNTILDQNTQGAKTSEAGFFKKSYYWKDITPDKGKLEVSKTSPGVAWGGMYRLYYENMDKIMAHNSSNIAVEKKLFFKTNEGPETKLREVTDNQPIHLGDVVVVRLVIKTDRRMEYIHLKDMRASGFEPVNVLSTYKWQNGAGYYESTKDAATHFFFSALPTGVYTFEYELKANNIGEFSDGITTFQNMYAPAMSAHTEGKRVTIVK